MPDAAVAQVFPGNDALCERCGYPLRGLPLKSDCPECGQAVAESSPARRGSADAFARWSLPTSIRVMLGVLLRPRRFFRSLPIDGGNRVPRGCLVFNAILTASLWLGMVAAARVWIAGYGFASLSWSRSTLVFFAAFLAVIALTYIEMLGVTAFSRRRGWRVPFRLAERVCCYASAGWLPGAVIAGLGLWLLRGYAVGSSWYVSYLGTVPVAWICNGALFVVSLLCFETLVWAGVRQVKYANA